MFQSWQKYFGAELWTDEYFDEYFAHSHKKRDEREAASSYVPEKVVERGTLHTVGSDTIFVQIYMDQPPGVPGVSKNSQKYATNKSVEFLR